MCVFCSLWCATYVLHFLSVDARMKEIWQRFNFAGHSLISLFLLFFIRYLNFFRNKKIAVVVSCLIWLPPLLTIYKSLSSNAVALDFPSGFWFLYSWIQTTAYNVASMVLILVYHLRHRTNKSRRQTLILIPSAVLCMVFRLGIRLFSRLPGNGEYFGPLAPHLDEHFAVHHTKIPVYNR